MNYKSNKAFRLLKMYEQVLHGKALRKDNLASEFNVTAKTVQRDIESLRTYLEDKNQNIRYDRKLDCYKLEHSESCVLNQKDIFALCKILIESRAFNKSEFEELMGKLLSQLLPEQVQPVKERIANEMFNYLPLQHGKPLLNILWDLAKIISNRRLTHIWYIKQDKTPRDYLIKPVGIMFSEFYFYLIARLADESNDCYRVYRIDRITDMVVKDEKFDIPYADKFSEAEFRKRVQFMYSGPLKRVKFIYKGPNVEAVIDRLPTANIVKTLDNGHLVITAESYGDGIDMWLRSQGEWVEVIK